MKAVANLFKAAIPKLTDWAKDVKDPKIQEIVKKTKDQQENLVKKLENGGKVDDVNTFVQTFTYQFNHAGQVKAPK